ncbi:cytochrome C [Pseudomonas sp. HMWF032]|uniref:c-type cytochrome n=1 Tax=Pseudomonas sp. HMWF032 TaxID=2056866 RepID=UPI000D355217|nr:cytochrome c [Pseudomonas sp. HMWF032]PTS84138.1 cytochrome C [Pseudomonas sp. HMWF032]PTT78827.1 cytochrome C [Pseudomonas sp. HMWF010]
MALLGYLTLSDLTAAELTLELGNGSQRLSSAQLLTHPKAQNIEIRDDVSYKRSMHYRAVPLAALLNGLRPSDHLQLVASDGFAAELSAAPALSQTGSQAWLAIEDPAHPWPALGNGKPSAGPFYLVWQNPAASQIGPEQWPFQLVSIRKLAPVTQRFPQLLPAADASPAVQDGFAQYQKNCMACHRLNGAGDSQFGPDLNIPHNPTEYFSGDFLTRYIRNPQSLRRWPQGQMPGFTTELLSDEQLGALLAYLRHMAQNKVQP